MPSGFDPMVETGFPNGTCDHSNGLILAFASLCGTLFANVRMKRTPLVRWQVVSNRSFCDRGAVAPAARQKAFFVAGGLRGQVVLVAKCPCIPA
jgi:hypothetical protein